MQCPYQNQQYTACHPRKTTTYILHVVPITTHTHDRPMSNGKKETKKRKECQRKEKINKESKKRKRKGKKRKDKKSNPNPR